MDEILIFTDGACSGNPGPGGWGAIVALCEGTVKEMGGGEPRTTNNRMEMGAALAALEAVADRAEAVVVCTDSTYVISGITEWIFNWKRKGWISSTGQPVLNRDIWEKLDAAAQARKGRLSWRYVRGHTGHGGNERCDEIAVAFSKGYPVDLYEGPRAGYSVELTVPGSAEGAAPARKAPRASMGARPNGGVYLSFLNGQLERHTTWTECQARVHGQSGARFKKVAGVEDEELTLRAWGLK